ncbi:MAG TPA: hypothetical protein V6C95_02710 [Coleofasciculaceae cyanobacterium]
MSNPNYPNQNSFLHSLHRYQDVVQPENLDFHRNLQEFAQRISYICNLETNGKLSSDEAYQKIKELWEQVERSKPQLGIGNHPFQDDIGRD